jgi:hypothetical protein
MIVFATELTSSLRRSCRGCSRRCSTSQRYFAASRVTHRLHQDRRNPASPVSKCGQTRNISTREDDDDDQVIGLDSSPGPATRAARPRSGSASSRCASSFTTSSPAAPTRPGSRRTGIADAGHETATTVAYASWFEALAMEAAATYASVRDQPVKTHLGLHTVFANTVRNAFTRVDAPESFN